MKLLITGATGLIGRKLITSCLELGYEINYLTTKTKKLTSIPNGKGFLWNPSEGTIDASCFDGVEVIVNLVGATIAKRWTKAYKKEIVRSRTVSIRVLADALRARPHGVRHMISASAIGVYPNSFIKYYTEDSVAEGSDFLNRVVSEWELALDHFGAIGVGVAKLRIGLVLANHGGAYPQLEKPIRMNVGAAFGTGKQWQSWIHLEDVAGIFVHVIKEELTGVYNVVAPNPVSNNVMTMTIAEVLDKRIILPNIPKIVMRLLLGEMHVLLFASQRVSSKKIQDSGYQFEYENLNPTIKALIK